MIATEKEGWVRGGEDGGRDGGLQLIPFLVSGT